MKIFAGLAAVGLRDVGSLQVHPELGRVAEVLREPQGRVGRDATLAVDMSFTRVAGTRIACDST
jgi:hypothetical protein